MLKVTETERGIIDHGFYDQRQDALRYVDKRGTINADERIRREAKERQLKRKDCSI